MLTIVYANCGTPCTSPISASSVRLCISIAIKILALADKFFKKIIVVNPEMDCLPVQAVQPLSAGRSSDKLGPELETRLDGNSECKRKQPNTDALCEQQLPKTSVSVSNAKE